MLTVDWTASHTESRRALGCLRNGHESRAAFSWLSQSSLSTKPPLLIERMRFSICDEKENQNSGAN